jgi:DNA-nicking Smr family endonuclease
MRQRPPHVHRHNPLDPLDGVPSDELDLHGFRAAEAVVHVEQYVTRERKRQPGALVHIITGKGRNSPNGSVLKGVVRRVLEADAGRRVAAWGRDHDDGGFFVRLNGGR